MKIFLMLLLAIVSGFIISRIIIIANEPDAISVEAIDKAEILTKDSLDKSQEYLHLWIMQDKLCRRPISYEDSLTHVAYITTMNVMYDDVFNYYLDSLTTK